MVAICIALGIVECAVNLSAHAHILNTVCPGLLNVTEKFVDKTCTLLTVQRQFIIVISFELWGQHSASLLSFIFIITRQNSVTSSRESFPCLLLYSRLSTNKKKQVFNFFFCRFPWKCCFFVLTLLPSARVCSRYSHAEL